MGPSRRPGGCFAGRNRCCGWCWSRCALRVSYFRISYVCPAPEVPGCVFHVVRFMRRVFGVASPRVAVACSRVEAPTRGFCFMFHVPRFEFRHSPCCAFGAPRFPPCVSRFPDHVSRLPTGGLLGQKARPRRRVSKATSKSCRKPFGATRPKVSSLGRCGRGEAPHWPHS